MPRGTRVARTDCMSFHEVTYAVAIALLIGGCVSSENTANDAGATSKEKIISTDDLERACNVDADCTIVFRGDVCAACRCDDQAIAKSAKPTYDTTLASLERQCAPARRGELCAASCIGFNAVCVANRCEACTSAFSADGGCVVRDGG